MRVLFVDSVAYRPYDCRVLQSEALGGTEATVLRVARGLAKEGLDVSLFQLVDAHREEAVIDGIRHVNDSSALEPDVVVHLRTAKLVAAFREVYPKARHLVWMHDLGGEWLKDEPIVGEELVCVSDFHCKQFYGAAWGQGKAEALTIHQVYNPVEIDGHRLDKIEGRLGFFSSPHKGLNQVMDLFAELRKARPELHLVVGNPGYMGLTNTKALPEGVTFLGELSHPRTLEAMSQCQVLFYPQTVFAETFGLVLAEANAMGVPVLCHAFGAAKEVLAQDGRLVNAVIDCTDLEKVRRALDRILVGDLKPSLDPRFKLENVITDWKELLGC